MDHLRADVNLRSVGQRDPLTEFKHEAFELFHAYSNQLRIDIAQSLFRFEIIARPHPTIQQLLSKLQLETNRSFLTDMEESQQPEMQHQQAQAHPQHQQQQQNAYQPPHQSTHHRLPPTLPPARPQQHQQQPEVEKQEPLVLEKDPTGRNESCPCGSGKKFKKCCALKEA